MTTEPTYGPPQRIVLSDIDIPFWRLVAIFIKWALVSRFRSSQTPAAHSYANFGTKGTLAII